MAVAVSLSPYEVIFRVGEPGKDVYVICSSAGRVVGKVDVDGFRHVRPGIPELGEGEVFGELALFASLPCSASVHCITDSE